MADTATLLAGQALFDPHLFVMLSASGLIRKPFNEYQCIHVFFHAK
jgi:hypothetical protein